MTITPKEASKGLKCGEELAIEKLCRSLNTDLTLYYNSGRTVALFIKSKDENVVQGAIQAFRENGWKCVHHHNSSDGQYWNFSAK